MPPEDLACALDMWRLITVVHGILGCRRSRVAYRRLRVLELQSGILLEMIDQIPRFPILLLLRFWLRYLIITHLQVIARGAASETSVGLQMNRTISNG